jgi:hypothetical protein
MKMFNGAEVASMLLVFMAWWPDRSARRWPLARLSR